MIANPPPITALLRAWDAAPTRDAAALAPLLAAHLGPQTWPAFLSSYRLYLQPIPMSIAREAWGLNQTQPHTPTPTPTPTSWTP
jgi:hypothetical protein